METFEPDDVKPFPSDDGRSDAARIERAAAGEPGAAEDEDGDVAALAESLAAAAAEALEVARFQSRDSQLADAGVLAAFEVMPEGVDPDAFARWLSALTDGDTADAQTDDPGLWMQAAALVPDSVTEDLASIVASQGPVFYARSCMTDAYARWMVLSLEGDDAATFAACVREESRVYPRPMKATSLDREPFCLPEERLAEIYDTLVEAGEQGDLRRTEASNGDVYYFSADYFSDAYARSVAEWYSVDRWESL